MFKAPLLYNCIIADVEGFVNGFLQDFILNPAFCKIPIYAAFYCLNFVVQYAQAEKLCRNTDFKGINPRYFP